MHARIATLSCVLFVCTVTPAHAASKSVDEATALEKKEAGATYANAMVDFERNAFDKALAGFRESYGVVRSPNSRFMIARTLAHLGRNAEAYTELDAVIAEAEALGARYTDTARAARDKRDQIRPRVAFIIVNVRKATKGTTVAVGGDVVDPDRLGKPIPVLPGETKVVVTPPGSANQTFAKSIQAGESGTLDVDLSEHAAPPPSGAVFHPKYRLEIEPHVVGETVMPNAKATRGAGLGARFSFEVSRTGFIDAEDSLALTGGGDWIGTSTDAHFWLPIGIQWNLWLLKDLSIFFEPGVALMVAAGTYVRPVLDVGVRYHVWKKLSIVGRVGVPGATIGASFLL